MPLRHPVLETWMCLLRRPGRNNKPLEEEQEQLAWRKNFAETQWASMKPMALA